MADQVEVPFKNAKDQAVLLLAAAEELGQDASVVQVTTGGFLVPKDVHDKAFPPKGRKKKSESEEG